MRCTPYSVLRTEHVSKKDFKRRQLRLYFIFIQLGRKQKKIENLRRNIQAEITAPSDLP
jgi:hypothetical protein